MANILKLTTKTVQLDNAIRDLKKIRWNDAKRFGVAKAKEQLKEDIVASIERGVSPVKGERRYVKYSESYTAQITKGIGPDSVIGDNPFVTFNKKLRPVNLTLSGKMLRSINGRVTQRGIAIWFSSGIAKYHDVLGAGKAKTIRRMLPDPNEQFKTKVTLRASKIIGKAFEGAIKAKI